MSDSLKEAFDRVADEMGQAEPDLPAIKRRGHQRLARRRGLSATLSIVAVVSIGLPLYALSSLGTRGAVVGTSSGLPANGEIWVRVGGGDGPSFVYRMDPETGEAAALFNDGQQGSDDLPGVANADAVGQQYDWSPNGQKVVFTDWSTDTPSRPVLYTMNQDGSDRTRVAGSDSKQWGTGEFNAYPAWSPDGTRIAYARGENTDVIVDGSQGYVPGCETSPSVCVSQVHVIDATGGNDHQLTQEPISATMPDWSPDGRSIVFVSATSDSTTRIGIIDVDGGKPTFLTDGSSEDLLPRWSPDGSRIAFISDRSSGAELYSMSSTGGDVARLSDLHQAAPLSSLTWSPDGTELAVSEGESLLILTHEGSIVQRIDPAPRYDVGDIAWRPAPSLPQSSEVGSPAPSTSTVLTVTCGLEGATVGTPVVAAQRDGVHLVIKNASNAWALDLHHESWGYGTAETVPFKDRAVIRSTSSIGPGRVTLACLPNTDSSYFQPGVPTAEVTVVDPEGFYVPWDLSCGSGEQFRARIDAPQDAAPEAVVAQVEGVMPGDAFKRPNYPDAPRYSSIDFIIFRDGEAIARTMLGAYDSQDGTWHVLINVCPGMGIRRA